MSSGLVSVIVPTKNSGEMIEMCLKSIKEQTYPDTEIIIVDMFSMDGTKEIALRYNAFVINSEASMSEARNIGIRISKGKFIFSVDADMELTPTVVEEAIKKSKEFDALIIPEVSFGDGFWARCRALEKECYIGDDTMESARFFKKEIFDSIKGYDRNLLFGEDKDVDIRIKENGYKIGRIESRVKHNEGKLDLWKTIKKKYKYCKTIGKYRSKHSKYFQKQSKLIRPAFTRNWKKLMINPIYSLGMIYMKGCEFAACYIGSINENKEKSRRIPLLTKIILILKTIKNPLNIFRNFIGGSFLIETSNCLFFHVRGKTTDLAEIIVVSSGFEYPFDKIEVPDNPLIIDIGSHIGTFSINICKRFIHKNPKIYSFEPFEENYRLLNDNIQINGLENYINIFKYAVGTENKIVYLINITKPDAIKVSDHKTDYKVEQISLDKVFGHFNNVKIDILKIDIEGKEVDIISKFKEIISNYCNYILLESHYGEDKTREMEKQLLSVGFKVIWNKNIGSHIIFFKNNKNI